MLLLLPILIPFSVAIVSLIGWGHLRLQRWLGIGGMFGLLASALALLATVRGRGILTVQIGDWPAPYGITLVADHLAVLMVLMAASLGTAVAVYSLVDLDRPRQSFAFYPLLHILLMGVCAAFLTGDLFNLYVWFEVVLISSFVLLVIGSEPTQLEGALKYVTLNLVSSFLFLTAVGILYGAVGTLNLADAAVKLPTLQAPGLVPTIAILFLMAFGIKAAIFPLFFWVPASYHTPPPTVSAIFAGLLTKVGVYALFRVFTLLFTAHTGLTHTLILVLSGLTMATGVLGAVAQTNVRRILAFHSISQIGYMLLGLGLFTPLGLAGSIFFTLHHAIVKGNLFLVSGIVRHLRGTDQLYQLGGLYQGKLSVAVLFGIPAASLAGIPPLSGFIAKLSLIRAGLEVEQYAVVAVAIAVSLLTLYSMTKIWNEVFWKPAPEGAASAEPSSGASPPRQLRRGEQCVLASPVIALAILAVLAGVAAEPVFAVAEIAAEELLDPSTYIDAVLGENR